MPSKFKSLKDVIAKENAFSHFRKSVSEQDVLIEFHNIFPSLKKTVSTSSVNKGILFINVENSVLRNEIHLNKQIMIKKINEFFNSTIIKDIKFTNFRKIHREKSD